MGGERPVLQPTGGEEPAATVGFERERIRAGVKVDPATALLRRCSGRFLDGEIGDVVAGPFAGRGVPPDVLFPIRPGLAGRVRRGAVIEDAAVAGPCESLLRIDIV